MSSVFHEYRNQHEHRSFPFLDNASLRSTDGLQLPTDFLVDALLHPIDLPNQLYLKTLSFTSRYMTFADTVTGAVHGIGYYDDTDVVLVYEDSPVGRQIGVVTLGAGRRAVPRGGTYTFNPEATTLTPAAYYPLNQPGVRGILLDSGTLYTGAVKMIGRNGVIVHSYIDNTGRHIIRFDVRGEPDKLEDCFDCPPIRCIRIEVENGSHLEAAHCQTNAACLTADFELAALCDTPSYRRIPQNPCEDPPAPPEPLPGSPGHIFTICPDNGRLYLFAPSADTYANPILITAEEDPAPPVDHRRVHTPVGASVDQRQRILERMMDATALSRGKIKIEFKGQEVL